MVDEGFWSRLESEAKARGLSLRQLAKDAGLKSETHLSRLKSEGSEPRAGDLYKIATKLGLSVEYLLTGEDAAEATGENNWQKGKRRFLEDAADNGEEFEAKAWLTDLEYPQLSGAGGWSVAAWHAWLAEQWRAYKRNEKGLPPKHVGRQPINDD